MGCFSLLKRFFLYTALISAVTGCGSGGSTNNNATGALAVNLTWSPAKSLSPAKTLYAAPAGVTTIKVFVYDAAMNSLITPKNFTVTPGVDGSGTIDGIPSGVGRIVRVEGLDSDLYLRYLGSATADIVNGQNTAVTVAMQAPVTTATPVNDTSTARFEVTLTASVPATIFYTTNEPAIIYYTTNGAGPTTSSSFGTSPVKNIWIEPGSPVTLKYFAVVRGLYESIKTKIYSVVP